MKLVVLQPQPTTSPCASCKALYGKSCCEVKDDAPRFPMTYAEAQRIAKHTKQDIVDAVTVTKVSGVARDTLRDYWNETSPEHAKLFVDGVSFQLPLVVDDEGNEQCAYLGPNGCTIPRVKPHTCALFPFSKSNRWGVGELVTTTGFCFGQDASGGDSAKAMETFGVTSAYLDSIERQRLRDMSLHRAQATKWNAKHGWADEE